jgi:predicted O-methyltransferase YrrM
MQHIYEHIEGWFTFPNLYTNIVKSINNDAQIVEVGSWLGQSASYMAVEIINSNKNIKFYCVDTWSGSEEHKEYDVIKNNELYEKFLNNIEPVKHAITPIRLPSIEASKDFTDNSLDCVFIDAGHDYESVKNDIAAWYPKVKSGGLLAGHDFVSWATVTQAVMEFLNTNKYNLVINSEFCWGIIKR